MGKTLGYVTYRLTLGIPYGKEDCSLGWVTRGPWHSAWSVGCDIYVPKSYYTSYFRFKQFLYIEAKSILSIHKGSSIFSLKAVRTDTDASNLSERFPNRL